MPDLPHKQRRSDRDVPETQMDHFFMNRKSDSALMTLLNFLDGVSGCTFACTVTRAPSDSPVSVICKSLEFRGRTRFVLRTDSEHAISALSMALCQAPHQIRLHANRRSAPDMHDALHSCHIARPLWPATKESSPCPQPPGAHHRRHVCLSLSFCLLLGLKFFATILLCTPSKPDQAPFRLVPTLLSSSAASCQFWVGPSIDVAHSCM